ncbi:alpha/beta hydrolase [Acidobacteriota bacterium]
MNIRKSKIKKICRFFRSIVFFAGVAFLLNVSFLTSQSRNLQESLVNIYSQVLDEERTVSISLPEQYESSKKKYSVLYVLDAEGDKSFFQSTSTVAGLHNKGKTPQMLVVGVWNTQRNRDMIPAAVSHRPSSGGSDKFLAFLKYELVPYINKNYRTENYSILYGMSNSALFAVYALLEAPETFNAYIASSPMIGHCPEYIKGKADSFINNDAASNRILYMIYGSDDSQKVVDYVQDFYDFLKLNAPINFVSEHVILEGGGHVPLTSLSRALQFIFEILDLPSLDYSRIKNATDARRRRLKLYSCTANSSQQSR